MIARSRMDLLLAKAEPNCGSDSTSPIMLLRKRGKTLQLQPERGVRIWERNSSADTKVSKGRGGGGGPSTRAEIPLQPPVKAMVQQLCPCSPMEIHCEAEIHLQSVETPTQVDLPEGGCDPMGSLHWNWHLA
ncbi:protein pxr1-like [Willisornis vidua]|uniref:Protein pxr1-like n=1 Tax=Willisornis vidua TaxID=1566151 RepID=A0ABQ9CZT1_9PASS|nr:protein pxr1-like [Willisornis vidua]